MVVSGNTPASSKQRGSSGQNERRRGFCSKSKSPSDDSGSAAPSAPVGQNFCEEGGEEHKTLSAREIVVPGAFGATLPAKLMGVPPTARGLVRLLASEMALPHGGLLSAAHTVSASEIGMPGGGAVLSCTTI
jgi:hypothetical protein